MHTGWEVRYSETVDSEYRVCFVSVQEDTEHNNNSVQLAIFKKHKGTSPLKMGKFDIHYPNRCVTCHYLSISILLDG